MFGDQTRSTDVLGNGNAPAADGAASSSVMGASPGGSVMAEHAGPSVMAPAMAANGASPAANWLGGILGNSDDGKSMKDVVKDSREGIRDSIALENAKDALKGKFQVDGGTGPNAVSKEEFEKVAKLYANIDQGKSDIKLDTSAASGDPAKAAELKQKAMGDMGSMLQTPAGRKLLGEMSDNQSKDPNDPNKTVHHTTTMHLTDNKFDPANDCDEKGMASARARGDNDDAKAINAKSTTPGVGTDAVINFHPGESKMLDGPNVQSTGDTALFHEMVHAEHMTHGTKLDPSAVVTEPGRDQGARQEEIATVGLGKYQNDALTENEYRRERKQLGDNVDQRPSYQ